MAEQAGVSRGFALSVGWFAALVGTLLAVVLLRRFGLAGADPRLVGLGVMGLVGVAYLVVETARHLVGRRR